MAMQTATLISVIALGFSFGTTAVSLRRTYMQDIQSARQELRGLLERLISIPRENLETMKKYVGDRNTLFSFDQMYNQENTLLSRQAAEIARRLPQRLVSATEHLAIAFALQRAYNLDGAREFLVLAEARATDFNDEIAAVRTTAGLDYLVGDPDNGRLKYKAALAIFTKYPGYDRYTQITTHVQTELNWANSEAGIDRMDLTQEHLANARTLVDSLPPGPGTDGWKAQMADAMVRFSQGNFPAPAGVPMPQPQQPALQPAQQPAG